MKSLQNQWQIVRVFSLVFFVLFSLTAIAVERNSQFYSPDLTVNKSTVSLDEQLQLIDAEIYLLKADLALQNNELTQVKNYIIKLMMIESVLKVTMRLRFESLKKSYYSALDNHVSTTNKNKDIFQPELSSILVLLPLSGDYAEVANQIIAGIEEQAQLYDFGNNIRFIDTSDYSSMFDLWELAKRYNPSFIIGPLIKKNIMELDELNVNLPSLYLNHVSNVQPYARSISLTRDHHLDRLIQYLGQSDKRIAVLVDNSNNGLAYKERVEASLAEQGRTVIFQKVEKSVHVAVKKLINADASYARKSWLQKTIATPLQYKERVRADIFQVVSFLPGRSAVQVKILLQYYHLDRIEHVWLPSRLPLEKTFVKSIGDWEETMAVLPAYFINSINNAQKEHGKTTINNDKTEELGIFYALGKLAVQAVVKIVNKDSSLIQSPLGELTIDGHNQMRLQAKLAWIHKGKLRKY